MLCIICLDLVIFLFFFSSRRRHTRGALVTGVQTCALPICIDDRRFNLMARGDRAWAPDRETDAAIVGAMRSGRSMSIEGVSGAGRAFADVYALPGAASAIDAAALECLGNRGSGRSEEHTSELQSLMRSSYAVFCLKKKKTTQYQIDNASGEE